MKFSFPYILIFAAIVLFGCENKTGDDVKPIVVITSPDNPPFEFKDTAKGGDEIIGFDIDVVKAIASQMNKEVKVIELDYAGIIPALQSGRADMAVATISLTEERKKSIDFSDTYFINKVALLVPKGSSLESEKGLSGKKVGVQMGSTHEIVAQKLQQTLSDLKIISLGKIGELVQELKNGRINAILIGENVAKNIAEKTPGLVIRPLPRLKENLVIAFPKGSKLVDSVNKALQEVKANGQIEAIAKKWFNVERLNDS